MRALYVTSRVFSQNTSAVLIQYSNYDESGTYLFPHKVVCFHLLICICLISVSFICVFFYVDTCDLCMMNKTFFLFFYNIHKNNIYCYTLCSNRMFYYRNCSKILSFIYFRNYHGILVVMYLFDWLNKTLLY